MTRAEGSPGERRISAVGRRLVKRLSRVRNSTSLNLVLGLVFIVTALLVVASVNSVMRRQALKEAESKARILLDRNLATHEYFTKELKPNLFAWTAPLLNDEYFDPSWMSSTYAVRWIDRYFHSYNGVDYSIKDAAVDARSPDNEADDAERAFIADSNGDPELLTRSFVDKENGVPYFFFLRRGEVLEEACLRCHGTPAAAPDDMVRQFGPERSFHREGQVGKVVSAVSVRIPLAAAYAEANRFSLQLSGMLIALLGTLFLVQYWIKQRLLFRPLSAIRDQAVGISTNEAELGELIPLPFGRELNDLTVAFNRMSVNLRRDRDRLEDRIVERTRELEAANLRLEGDIAARKEVEERLRRAAETNRNLLDELQHRAKNSFSMIIGMVDLMSLDETAAETKTVLEYLSSRIRAISELYSLLYSTGSLTEVRFDEYCRRISAPLVEMAENVGLELETEAVSVPVKDAAALGLVVTELITNALKYAFPGGRPGSITVSLRRTETAVRLEIKDDGVGLPPGFDLNARAGMGLSLVRDFAAQVDGAFSISGGAGGTSCVLEFPLQPSPAESF
jgi:two-component sensor histidine kinase